MQLLAEVLTETTLTLKDVLVGSVALISLIMTIVSYMGKRERQAVAQTEMTNLKIEMAAIKTVANAALSSNSNTDNRVNEMSRMLARIDKRTAVIASHVGIKTHHSDESEKDS